MALPWALRKRPPQSGSFPKYANKLKITCNANLNYGGRGRFFINYSSLEEPPYASEVLDDLATKHFVRKTKDIHAARDFLNGHTPVCSKMALVTSEKDGVLKRRLVLDCRVSGANDKAVKRERIILPRLWDVVTDATHLYSCCRDGEEV